MNEITAPYNFVTLSAWIHCPDWAAQVSHDIPFRDGLSSTLRLSLTAKTPLLIGGEQKKASKEAPGEVHFCEINGHKAIAGTALKGMIRNVLEIATFAKLDYVDDRRLGIRDISGKRVASAYTERVNKDRKSGFMRLLPKAKEIRKADGTVYVIAEIIPCEHLHMSHRDMADYLQQPRNPCLFTRGMTVGDKYNKWKNLTQQKTDELPTLRFDKHVSNQGPNRAIPRQGGGFQGRLVFTGQISDKCSGRGGQPNKHGKGNDFMFYHDPAKPAQSAQDVPKEVWDAFLFIHGDKDSKHEGPWRHYWKTRFFKNQEIPVFYHVDKNGEVRSVGLAYMYRLAYTHSIAQTIGHTNPYHHSRNRSDGGLQHKFDLPELLFGRVDEEGEQSLKSRVSFGNLYVDGDPQPVPLGPTILNGPKPSYFPNYLKQAPNLAELPPYKGAYTTYMDDKAEILGWKRYPVRNGRQVQALNQDQEENKSVQVKLYPLPEETRFNGSLRFHNLKPVELGALLWALEWGGEQNLRHALGMGKSFGFGQAAIEVQAETVFSNRQPALLRYLNIL